MSLSIDEASCTGCGCCILVCPEDAVEQSPSFTSGIDRDRCTECLSCLEHCPNLAIRDL